MRLVTKICLSSNCRAGDDLDKIAFTVGCVPVRLLPLGIPVCTAQEGVYVPRGWRVSALGGVRPEDAYLFRGEYGRTPPRGQNDRQVSNKNMYLAETFVAGGR